ncbi:phosphoenolpyruvate--protein phosphotransferase [Nitratidesulfovibrio liaohensis]|uniref:Phosphoenolpyruvate--protein phosphotransferase n=1 Tax=Nitratidesulfovibrio liaohensis TaxID=2604158 RepID=A0ABY9R0D5_9BACT|nr:phosphoenolpyruvate--protein phosphotransferase [Nitratidesulfovibrio liaohensis]WMW64924.1 phosphoenolpyruvate--protein phosphotransferase [Nitratidesulfovibrio liaohensis]
MVGIVVVTHSAVLGQGVKELAEQMTQGRVPLAVAGGIDDPDHPIGTDPMRVMAAIEEVQQGDGVLVLMDLGSALMSAETALDLLPPEVAAQVRLCPAPLVEGVMAAAVQASIGADLDTVLREAQSALAAKAELLGMALVQEGGGMVESPPPAAGVTPAVSHELTLMVPNRLGLHARPAARIVTALGPFVADVQLARGERVVSARSVNRIATLAVRGGETVTFRATGVDAEQALKALADLAAQNFGDLPDAAGSSGKSAAGGSGGSGGQGKPAAAGVSVAKGGVPASPGIAVGPAVWHRPAFDAPPPDLVAGDPASEAARLDAALDAARRELAALERRTAAMAGKQESEIFVMHRLLLDDATIAGDARQRIAERHEPAEAAWYAVIDQAAESFRQLPEGYMRERAADLVDVGARVLRLLTGAPPSGPRLDRPSVLLATDLGPSDMAHLDPALVLGIVTAQGGATSHAAILARSMGIPAVAGAGALAANVADGVTVALDGTTGEVWIAPAPDVLSSIESRRASWLAARQAALAGAARPAVTVDGRHLHVHANIGTPADAAPALLNGAEGVGLFRTEFLFLDRADAPDEEEQRAAYVAAAAAMPGLPVVVRTLDIGGDKPVPYLGDFAAGEDNPFLGLRGIRFCLARRELFLPQLRALLRAAAEHPLRVMFPMVAHPGELAAAKALLEEARAALAAQGLPHGPVEVGIMVEVPAAVALADQLARESAFFSIGTNDLAQYVMAADRGNAAVADLSDALHPAVLRMVRDTVAAGNAAGIPVAMCGELAGSAEAIPLLVGLGLDELSMNGPAIPRAKDVVRGCDMAACARLAERALELPDAAAVRRLLRDGG